MNVVVDKSAPIHVVIDQCEFVGGYIPVLRHGERRAPGHEDRLVAAAERQLAVEVAPHQDDLLVAEPGPACLMSLN